MESAPSKDGGGRESTEDRIEFTREETLTLSR
jgi:hypothetical protein